MALAEAVSICSKWSTEHGIDQRYIHLLASIIFNVSSGDDGLILFPVGGGEMGNLKRLMLKADHSKDILIVEGYGSGNEDMIPFNADFDESIKEVFDTRDKQPEKHFVYVIGLDLFEYYSGSENSIKLLEKLIDRILNDDDVLIGVVKRPQHIIDIISHNADRHFVFKDLNGSLCMYGMRPKTVIYNISSSDSDLIFTPIV